MTPWRLLDEEGPREGAWNMALDEVLWQRAEEGLERRVTVRLFAWNPPCLSIGYHQEFSEACDAAFCRRAGIDIVRRPTGGKAVLHDDEVTYSVTAPFDAPPFDGLGLVGTYDVIAGALAGALSLLGLDVEIQERRALAPPSGAAPCFLVPSQKEILSAGRKIVGSAQRRGKRAFLQHGAVPIRLDYAALAGAAGRPPEDAEHYRAAFAGVGDLREGVTASALCRALQRGFAQAFGCDGAEEVPGLEEASLAEHLRAARYAGDAWTRTGKDVLARAV